MTPPILPFGSVIGIEAASNAGLDHTARRVSPRGERLANGEVTNAPTLGEPICCLYRGINSTQADIAAARGIEATGTLKVLRGQSMPAGTKWQVEADDCDDLFAVEVTGDLVGKVSRAIKLVAVKDAALNRP